MYIYKPLIFLLVLSTMLLTSCSDKTDQNELIEKYDSNISTNSAHIDIEWLEDETEYSYTESDTTYKIVDCLNDYLVFASDRVYIVTKADDTPTYSYININTGEIFPLCPDPLCNHTKNSGCRYLSLSGLIVEPEHEDVVYTIRTITNGGEMYGEIVKIDIENNTIDVIYSAEYKDSLELLQMLCVSDQKLYFKRSYRTETTDGGKVVANTTVTELMEIDLGTYDTHILQNEYASGEKGYIQCASNEYFYFTDMVNRRVFTVDKNFENERIIYEYPENYTIRDLYYDSSTSELYISLCSRYMVGLSDDGIIDGYIICIDKNNNVERLDTKSDRILKIQLTRNYIYYTAYDPIKYGISPRGTESIDETGGKIYRISRDDVSTEPELIFDGRGELVIQGGFAVIGDCLYLDYSEIVKEGGMAWFRWHGINARVNFVDGTIKWLT